MSDGPIRHVVFDLDGTLVDSAVQCAAIVSAMRRARGATDGGVTAARWRALAGDGRALVATTLGALAGDPDADLAEFRARYAAVPTSREQLFPGAVPLLEELRDRGVALSICSAKPQALCEQVLADVGIAPLFGQVGGSAPGRPLKPDPRHLLDLVDRGGRPALFVGDSDVDARTARAAGVAFLWLDHRPLLGASAGETVVHGFVALGRRLRPTIGGLEPSVRMAG